MTDSNDMELLRDYDRHGSEAAFAALVERHIHLVYSVALRHTGIAAHAEEITQAVFVILARKAASLRPNTILEGWLHETTRLTALSFQRGERRRQFREQEAYMQSTLSPSDDADLWNQLAPLLDEAVSRLGQRDRDAVMLRFFKGRNLREVAAVLNVNEAAAQRRVHRAVEKLRSWFTKRGVTLTATVLTAAMAANSVQAAPLGLAASVTATAAKGAVVSASTLTLIKGALKTMAWIKAKMVVAVTAGVLLAAGTVTVVVEQFSGPSITEEMWLADWESIKELPPVLILRPTRFADNPMGMGSEGRYVYRNQPFDLVFDIAYPGIGGPRCIQKVQIPTAGYQFTEPAVFRLTNGLDLMLTLTNRPIEALRKEICRKYGFVAHREFIETNVLLMMLAKATAATPGLRAGKGKGAPMNAGGMLNPNSGYSITNAETLRHLAGRIENALGIPVLDHTGLKGFYDVSLSWDWKPLAEAGNNSELRNETLRKLIEHALLMQLGLELVPSRAPIEMLVVEKVK